MGVFDSQISYELYRLLVIFEVIRTKYRQLKCLGTQLRHILLPELHKRSMLILMKRILP